MKFEALLAAVGEEPLFETGLLLPATWTRPPCIAQLSRWVKAGRLYQLRWGLYAVAPPFQRVRPHPLPGGEPPGVRLLCGTHEGVIQRQALRSRKRLPSVLY